MNITKLSNNELLDLIKNKSQEEKHLTLEVIQLIREVEMRRLFLELGYGSLFDYVTKELGYEETSAVRRISAARLIKVIPELEQKVAEGRLSLSSLNQAQSFFRREEKLQSKKLSVESKKEVLELLENKSTREVQKILIQLSPNQITLKESRRVISEELIEVKVIISDKLKNKLDKLKNLLSHTNPSMTQAELLEKLADIALLKLDPETKSKKQNLKTLPAAPQVQKKISKSNLTGRYIPSTIKQEVYIRDKGCCTYTDQQTERRCTSRHLLQYDHIKPMALNGETSIANLRLLCFQHHRLITEKTFKKD